MSTQSMAPLDDVTLVIFFEDLQDWYEIRDNIPPPTKLIRAVARYHIVPNLGAGRAANLHKLGEAEARHCGLIFQFRVNEFILKGEPANRDQSNLSAEELKLHQTHLDMVVSEIVNRILHLPHFEFQGVEKAIRYIAQNSVDSVEKLIDPSNRGKVIITAESPEPTPASSNRRSVSFLSPEIMGDRVLYSAFVKNAFHGNGDKNWQRWLILVLLEGSAEYFFNEIAAALYQTYAMRKQGASWQEIRQQITLDTNWSTPDVSSQNFRDDQAEMQGNANWQREKRRPPRYPGFVWEEISIGYGLPPWFPHEEGGDSVCSLIPPPKVTKDSSRTSCTLRQFTSRGWERLKRRVEYQQ